MPLLAQAASKFFADIGRLVAATFFVLLRIVAFLAMGVVLIVTAGIFWFFWHPRVVIPLQGTNLALIYQHKTYSELERLVLAEASLSTPLAEQVSRIYKSTKVGGQLWRSPDGSAYYLELQEGLFR